MPYYEWPSVGESKAHFESSQSTGFSGTSFAITTCALVDFTDLTTVADSTSYQAVQPAYWRAFRKALFPPSVKNIIMQNVTANDSQKTDFTIGSARPNIVRQAPTNFTGAPTPLPPIPGNGNGNGNVNISFQQVTTAQAPARPAAVELTRSEEIQALPTFPKSPADLSKALSGLVPVLHHCQFYAAEHAAE